MPFFIANLAIVMFNSLRESINHLVPLSEADFLAMVARLTVQTVPKKGHILRQGEVCRHVAFINKGCFRYYTLRDGDEYTGQFFFEGGWITDYESFLTKKPASLSIEALEDSELLLLRYDDLQHLYNESHAMERFGRFTAEQIFISVQSIVLFRRDDTPEERYRKLMQERPKVMQRVSQHHIASYLGIKPESLSRIRKRLTDE